MTQTFLIGGGRDPDGAAAAHAPFLAACDGPILCICLEDPDRWLGYLGGDARATDAPVPADLEGVAGVYVAGGLTPAYWSLVCDSEFGAALRAWDGVYCGYSAGAAIAAERALVGGWKVGELEVCDADFSEELEQVDVRPGLGRVDLTVEVHASQWGTLTRLVHVVCADLTPAGIAIDEHTCVELTEGAPVVTGRGVAYHVCQDAVRVLRPAA
jgi:cyanophycinase